MATAPRKRTRKYRDRVRKTGERGYGHDWQKLRDAFIAQYPFCTMCLCRGRTAIGRVVDHVTPHQGNQKYRLDWSNLQTLCTTCHNSDKQRIEERTSQHNASAEWIQRMLNAMQKHNAYDHVRGMERHMPPSLSMVLTLMAMAKR